MTSWPRATRKGKLRAGHPRRAGGAALGAARGQDHAAEIKYTDRAWRGTMRRAMRIFSAVALLFWVLRRRHMQLAARAADPDIVLRTVAALVGFK